MTTKLDKVLYTAKAHTTGGREGRSVTDDGLLDVCIVGAMSRLRLATLLPTVFLGRHLGIPGVHYFQTATLGLQSATPLDLYADGEFIAQTPARITLLPGALQVIA